MVRGKAPLRVSFAGGGTDLNHVFEKHGGIVISTTIDKFCHMSIEKREDKKIIINQGEKNKLVNDIVRYLQPEFGFNLTYYNDVEGSGLGGSSSFTVLLVTLILELQGKKLDDRTLVKIAYEIENENGLSGWQDQYATTVGGISFMEFNKDSKLIYPLRLKYATLCELEEHLVLCKVGGKHKSSKIQKAQKVKLDSIEEMVKILELKDIAIQIRDCLLNQNVKDIGRLLAKGWEIKRNELTSNPEIDKLYQKGLKVGAIGGRLCGAGQGGYILFFVKPENRQQLINKIGNNLQFHLAPQGVETW